MTAELKRTSFVSVSFLFGCVEFYGGTYERVVLREARRFKADSCLKSV